MLKTTLRTLLLFTIIYLMGLFITTMQVVFTKLPEYYMALFVVCILGVLWLNVIKLIKSTED